MFKQALDKYLYSSLYSKIISFLLKIFSIYYIITYFFRKVKKNEVEINLPRFSDLVGGSGRIRTHEAVTPQMISSQRRYVHFGTLP